MESIILEMVPPPLKQGREGLERFLDYIGQVRHSVAIRAVNIPEIHEEKSHNRRGSRRSRFVPRMAPREFARCIRDELGLESMINHVVAHQPEEELARWLEDCVARYGVRQFVLVGGESSDIDYPGPGVCAANRLARSLFDSGDVRIGNIYIPGRPDESERLRAKSESGVDFFNTQIIYEAADLERLCEDIAGGSADTEMNLSFCPVRSERNIRFLQWLGVNLSPELEAWLLAEDTEARSRECIGRLWSDFLDTLAASGLRFRAGINLCPIGKIPLPTTIGLALELQRISNAHDN